MTAEIVLNATGRRHVRSRHPWVYRGHIASGVATSGALVRVLDHQKKMLGIAAWSAESRIALRFVEFGEHAEIPSVETLKARFRAAIERRAPLAEVSDCARIVSSEADGFPGLIIDRYGDACVLQALTPFAEHLTGDVLEWLAEFVSPRAVVARNDGAVSELEGLKREAKTLVGTLDAPIVVREGDLKFEVDLTAGQKTGLFLDQRANRMKLGAMVPAGASVLDMFSYVGGFALHAARRAASVIAVDDSARAVGQITKNAALNGLTNVTAEKANAFQRLRDLENAGARFDVVVLDPPAFAKNRAELDDGVRGYHDINVRAFRLVRPGGLLVSASCSYHLDEATFEDVLKNAAADAEKDAIVIERRGQDVDHPVLLGLPESRYLKCFFLGVR